MYNNLPIQITPCNALDLQDGSFVKLNLSETQHTKMNAFVANIPTLLAANELAKAYVVEFPKNVTGTLMHLKDGSVGSQVIGENGKIVAQASFHGLGDEALALNAFSVMAAATGQYFLSQINSQMGLMNQKIDQIMGFLYGDKKAELIAEISFVKYAFENYSSIMLHDSQQVATISSLQESRKIAIKDIEFYMYDLTSKATAKAKNYQDFQSLVEDAFQIRRSLELSMQLYVSSSIMESYYAENSDHNYLESLRADMTYYINKCNGRILSVFSKLNGRNSEYKATAFNKIDTSVLDQEFEKVIYELSNGENSKMHELIDSAILQAKKDCKIFLTNKGDAYLSA